MKVVQLKTVVISQPMYAPWPGFFELISLADVFVVYDDVQMPLGRSFTSRVQIKTPAGHEWMTVPIRRQSGQLICEVEINEETAWRRRHEQQLAVSLKRAPHARIATRMMSDWMREPYRKLCDLDRRTVTDLMFQLGIKKEVVLSSDLGISGKGTDRLVELVLAVGGDRYVTAHGAANYMDHNAFERRNIKVDYVRYSMMNWAQDHGAFTPYVSTLDLIGYHGKEARNFLRPSTIPWRQFVGERQASILS